MVGFLPRVDVYHRVSSCKVGVPPRVDVYHQVSSCMVGVLPAVSKILMDQSFSFQQYGHKH